MMEDKIINKDFIVRSYQEGDEQYVAQAHERIYLEEYHWGSSFGNYAKKVVYDFAESSKNPREELWIAEANEKQVGCIMLAETDNPNIGQLRLFLVEKNYRNKGVGSALTDVLLKKAQSCGYRKLILWTVEPLTAARHHYKRIGFRYLESVPNSEWSLDGETVNEEKWELCL